MRKDEQAEIFIDIETIPSQLPWVRQYISDTIKAPGQMKKVETIEKWYAEEREGAVNDAMDKCSFDGAMNHIICIGVAIDHHAPIVFYADEPHKEVKLLKDFYQYLQDNVIPSGNTFVGHNIVNFDLRIIKQRSIVLGVAPSVNMMFDSKPWDDMIYDTMLRWDSKNFTKLEKIAMALGITQKKTMQGHEIYGAWKNGLHEQIAEYCGNDVSMTRDIYRAMAGVC